MTKLTKIALLALAAAIAGTTMASAAPIFFKIPKLQGPHNSDQSLECRVINDGFYVINFGDKNLDSGRQIAWNSPETGDAGMAMVPKMLAPGEEARIADLSFPVPAGTRCDVSLA